MTTLKDLPICPECGLRIENEFEHFPYEVCDPKFVKTRRARSENKHQFKVHASVRIKAFQKDIIKKEFGSVQKYLDHKIKIDEQEGMFDD